MYTAILSISTFVILQVLVSLLFKWGSNDKKKWIWGFIIGNIIAIVSTWFLMIAYKYFKPNTVFGICMGSAFILTQVALSVFFKSKLTAAQWLLLLVIAAGMTLFTILGL